MTRQDYYAECLSEAFDECGIVATPEQLALVADHVEGAAENVGMAFYQPESPYPREIKRLETELRKERDKIGCPTCAGRGRLEYNAGPWGVNTGCHTCHGEGKVNPMTTFTLDTSETNVDRVARAISFSIGTITDEQATAAAEDAIKTLGAGEEFLEFKEALDDLRSLRAEHRALNGGGPGWAERNKAAWARVDELFANEDEAAYGRQQEDAHG